MEDIRLAVSGQQLRKEKSLEEILAFLRSFSVSWIELWTVNLIGGFQGNRCKDEDLKRTKDLLDDYEMGVACITDGGAFKRKLAELPSTYINSLKETINVAKELNSSIVNCYAANFGLGPNVEIDLLANVMQPVIEHAEKMDVTVVLENEAHAAAGTPKDMLRLLKTVDSKHFQTNYDATNYYPANVEPFPYAYEVLKEYVAYVHLKNGCIFIAGTHPEYAKGQPFAPPNDSERIFYTPLPEGTVNIEGIISRLKRDGYKGFCTLEPHVKSNKLMKCYNIDIPYMKKKGIR